MIRTMIDHNLHGRTLIFLCHKFRRRIGLWQQGHRGRARAMTIRMEAIEVPTWRSGRIGGSAGLVTTG
jgi:hypothetical protein